MVERIELEDVVVEIDDAEMRIIPTSGDVESSIYDILEGLVTDHGFEWIAPEEICALTDADIIGRGVVRDGEEILSVDDLFWDSNYMVTDLARELALGRCVSMVRSNNKYEAEIKLAATLLQRVRNAESDFVLRINPWGIQVDVRKVPDWPWEPVLLSETNNYEAIHFRCERYGQEVIGVMESEEYRESGVEVNGMRYIDALIKVDWPSLLALRRGIRRITIT